MKALVVGGGGREHALAWALRRGSPSLELLAAPGNPGIAQIARCVAVAATDVEGQVALARGERVDLVVVGPEAPLALGLVDRLRAAGIPAFGPTAAAACLETSKRFAKEVMTRAAVPTARASAHTDVPSALRAVHALGAPVVVKASGLAAGKGVIVAATLAEAEAAVRDMLEGALFGAAGAEVLVEEFMQGEELSLFAITDGERVLPMLAAQDHKRLLPGDLGPNTGGMGAYAPVGLGTPELVAEVERTVFAPTLAAMREAGTPFTGLLYAGLMLTDDGPRVVEFNCRFGDPETQAILPLLESPLLEVFHAVGSGAGLAGVPPLAWRDGAAVTTVLAASGYPETPRTGDVITLPDADDDVLVFHAGTKRRDDGALVTAGGRVLSVTGLGPSFDEARAASAGYAARVGFAGSQFRDDIGWRESARRAGAA